MISLTEKLIEANLTVIKRVLMTNPLAVIAGGAGVDIYHGISPRDVDVFLPECVPFYPEVLGEGVNVVHIEDKFSKNSKYQALNNIVSIKEYHLDVYGHYVCLNVIHIDSSAHYYSSSQYYFRGNTLNKFHFSATQNYFYIDGSGVLSCKFESNPSDFSVGDFRGSADKDKLLEKYISKVTDKVLNMYPTSAIGSLLAGINRAVCRVVIKPREETRTFGISRIPVNFRITGEHAPFSTKDVVFNHARYLNEFDTATPTVSPPAAPHWALSRLRG